MRTPYFFGLLDIWLKKVECLLLEIVSSSLTGDLRLLHIMLSLDRCSQLLYLTILTQAENTESGAIFEKLTTDDSRVKPSVTQVKVAVFSVILVSFYQF